MAIPGVDWEHVPGQAYDIGVSPDGSGVFHLGNETRIYRWDGHLGWTDTGEIGQAVAGGLSGDLWFVSYHGQPYRKHPSGRIELWNHMRGTDIGVGADGTVWLCFYQRNLDFRGIWRWHEATDAWQETPGYGSRITGGDGAAWHVGQGGALYRWVGRWQRVEGQAQDIGVGPKGEAWHAGEDDRLYYWESGRWVGCEMRARRVALGPRGLPWVVNDKGEIYRRI